MILIIDDHLDTCRALLKVLERAGIPAECVDDPAAAIRVIESLRPKLLVLDQMMPGLLGTDLLQAIRGIPSLADIPTIFYSATLEGEQDARRLGALDWLVKGSTDWDALRTRIVDVYKTRIAEGTN